MSQDVLCKLLCRKEPFNGPEHERAWVIRCTSNALQGPPEERVEAKERLSLTRSPRCRTTPETDADDTPGG